MLLSNRLITEYSLWLGSNKRFSFYPAEHIAWCTALLTWVMKELSVPIILPLVVLLRKFRYLHQTKFLELNRGFQIHGCISYTSILPIYPIYSVIVLSHFLFSFSQQNLHLFSFVGGLSTWYISGLTFEIVKHWQHTTMQVSRRVAGSQSINILELIFFYSGDNRLQK